jgi:hypothetical protein
MNLKFWERSRPPQAISSRSPTGVLVASSKLAPLTEANLRTVIERVPIRFVAEGRLTESDLALAATTPILGQYAPQFGWPDDWGLYWEYLDAYLFIPEVAFSVKLKSRLVWKPGWELETKDEHAHEEFIEKWKQLRLYQRLKGATKNALIWGNAYLESVDNSDAQWEYGQPSEGGALGIGAPRPLKSWRPATQFYGLKQVDPRTMRVQINPQRFDVETSELFIEKFIQRRWAGPLGPTMTAIMGSNVEIDFHPRQMIHLRFNRLPDGIYGYSHYRECIFALKGYMVMLQYLPAIVQKRADPLLHLVLGKRIMGEDGRERDYLPSDTDFAKWKSTILNRAPSEDIFTDMLTTIEEVYKTSGLISGINDYITVWKERILLGLGIPQTMMDVLRPGAEVKWGELKYEVLEDEILEYQQEIEFLINEKLLPRLIEGDAEFHFNPITPEDWRANVGPLLDLFKLGVVSAEYMRDRLDMPAEAGQGTMFQPPAQPEIPKDAPSEKESRHAETKQKLHEAMLKKLEKE